MSTCPYCQRKFETSFELENHLKEYKEGNGKGEQLKHKHLKNVAKDFLREIGFAEDDIKEEYWVQTEGMRERIRVDVVGMTKERRVAIECGRVSAQKMSWLNLFFDEVINLPYMNDRVSHGSCSDALKSQVRSLESQLEEANKRTQDLERKLELMRRQTEDERVMLGKAVIVGLFKIGSLPTELLHMNYDRVIRDYETELQARQTPPFVQAYSRSMNNPNSNAVGLLDARI